MILVHITEKPLYLRSSCINWVLHHLLSMLMVDNQKGVSLDMSAVRVFSSLCIINAVCSISIWVVLEQQPRICSPFAITNHPPLYIIHRSCIDGSCAWPGENTVSFSRVSTHSCGTLKKCQARCSSAVNWYNCSEDNTGVITLWEHGSSSNNSMWQMSILQLALSVELFDYRQNLKTFNIFIHLLSYLKICSIFSQMLFNTVTELKNPAPLCLHCSSIGL